MRLEGKIELDRISQRQKVELNQKFRRSLHNYKDKSTVKICKKVPRGSKKLVSCWPRVTFATPWLRVWLWRAQRGMPMPSMAKINRIAKF